MFEKLLQRDHSFQELLEALKKNRFISAEELEGGAKPLYIWGLANSLSQHVLVVTAGPQESQDMFEMIFQYNGGNVLHFPAQEVLPHDRIPIDISLRQERQSVLEALSFATKKYIVVTSIQALLQGIIPPEIFKKGKIHLALKKTVNLTFLGKRLMGMGYERVEQVENWGQYSLRGGIVDIFPTTAQNPVRIEFFADVIDSLRTFDIATQRSLEKKEEILITPAIESFIPEADLGKVLNRIRFDYEQTKKRLLALGKVSEVQELEERMDNDLERLEEGVLTDGLSQYLPYIYGRMASLLEYCSGSLLVFDLPNFIETRAKNFSLELAELYTSLLEQGSIITGYMNCFQELPTILADLKDYSVIFTAQEPPAEWGFSKTSKVSVSCGAVHSFYGQLDNFASQIKKELLEGGRVVLSLNGMAKSKKMGEYLHSKGLDYVIHSNELGTLADSLINICPGTIKEGFYLGSPHIFVHAEEEILGKQEKRKKKVQDLKEGLHISSIHELETGDYVVHETHGIGRYLGVRTEIVLGIHQDYLIIKYAGEDRLLVPTHQIGLIQKYIGGEEIPPRLYRLGGGDWNRIKKKVKESLQDMAYGLLRLYAEREATKGYSFSADTVWQKEFEDSFPYEETADQRRAVQEIKYDMEQAKAMDRLLCGDVGYGKTEVAIRASFKAVMDGKQVAVLVPTTILAQQHFNTFLDRFDGYPVNIDMLSRFRSPAKQKEILKKIKRGEIDIIIGTHRILSKDLTFFDLGLLVVDEEQRFGVGHKERIKEIKKNVDVLTLTATPIPRTLHMSMVGVRDMSIIETPPQDRYPIRTYVREYNKGLIGEALNRELSRGGQVYFVHNRVGNIKDKADEIAQLVPNASIGVAHGQMPEGELEKVMLDFLKKRYDILLCTTIIETGMDMPNVNTIIINDADQMGLAQLYQLRGRVGRSNRVAYAYLLYKKAKVLSEVSEKRLMAIREFTSLGSGFKLAMRDLEIRGAGNILGPEQHGHIMAVGFSLYCKLLEESVQELSGQRQEGRNNDIIIDTDWDAYIPDDYIKDTRQKIEIYKKVSRIRCKEDQEDMFKELIDRFGEPPLSVRNLLTISHLRLLAQEKQIKELRIKDEQIGLVLANGATNLAEKFMVLGSRFSNSLKVKGTRYPQLLLNCKGSPKEQIQETLEELLAFL